MRFLIILAAALAVARGGSYGGGYGKGHVGRGFNAHQLDIPVGYVRGGGGSTYLQGGGGSTYLQGVNAGVGLNGVNSVTYAGGLNGVAGAQLSTGGGVGIYDEAIGGGTAYIDGGIGVADYGFDTAGINNARIYDSGLGYANYEGFNNVPYDYGYDFGGTAAYAPGSSVTVLTRENRGRFLGPIIDRIAGPKFEIQQGYVVGPGSGGLTYGGDDLYYGGGADVIAGGAYDAVYPVGGASISYSSPVVAGGYPVGGVVAGGTDFYGAGGLVPVGGGGNIVSVNGGGGLVPVPGPVVYGGGVGAPIAAGVGNFVGGAANAVGNVAAGAANVVGGLVNTAGAAGASLAQGFGAGLNAVAGGK